MKVSGFLCIAAFGAVTLVYAEYPGSISGNAGSRDGSSVPGGAFYGRGGFRSAPVFASAALEGEKGNMKRLDELDKVYDRLNNIVDQMKTFAEQIDAVSAHLSEEQRKLKEAVLGIFLELTLTDKRQNEAIDELEDHLDQLEAESDLLHVHIQHLDWLTENNTLYQEQAEQLWAEQKAVDIRQERDVITLYRAVKDFKTKLFQVESNEFEVFQHSVERTSTLLSSIKKRENRRMCESGQVTLGANELRAQYQYQNWFDNVPQIIWGICGFKFDRDTTKERGNEYGYGYPKPPESEAIGVRIKAYSTKTGLKVEGFDLSFGGTSAMTVDVCFEACTIGPGTAPVDH